jgi:nicotinamide phosphoribosyltransferase
VDQNLLLLTDSYKATHWKQYPPGTERIYSYFESRGGRFDEVVFFGLQYYLERYLAGRVVTQERIERAADFWARHFGDPTLFNRLGWEHVLREHGGRLPVSIRAVPEGTPVPLRNVMMSIENTDPRCYWLTNHLETLLVQVWYGSTVATLSREMKRLILDFLERTGDPALIPLKLHDFGFRGTSSVESASLGGAAHLVNFEGTDTVAGCLLAQEYYAADMPGTSIPASEHSTITAWGPEEELGAFENMLNAFPTGTVACVSDSWDIFRACAELWGSELRDRVLAREGTLVIRPDSGDPPAVVTRVLDLLGDAFGAERNAKGFKILPPQVRVIQGDGIGYEMTGSILSAMERAGWSADNITFGMGGGLLQKLDRDTQEFAFKCSEITRSGVARDVYKDPVTDHGKHSKRGRLKLIRTGTGGYATVPWNAEGVDLLREVFRDGRVTVLQTFEEIRARAALRATR